MAVIAEALQVVRKAKQEINGLLKGAEHRQNLLEINSHFERIDTRLKYVAAIVEPQTLGTQQSTQFAPIKKKNPPKKKGKGEEEDKPNIDPRRAAFLKKAKKLWESIGDFTPEMILMSYRIPEDILVLRWVAKKAGLKDYEKAILNTKFVEKIQAAVQDKKDVAQLQIDVDTAAGKGEETDPDNTGTVADPDETDDMGEGEGEDGGEDGDNNEGDKKTKNSGKGKPATTKQNSGGRRGSH